MEPVNKGDESLPAEPNTLLCCRGCLATQEKLFNMREYNLIGEFCRVTGIIVNDEDKLPQHLCVWCAALMKRYIAFRAKCLRADQCLQILGDQTTDSICNVDRLANRLVDIIQTETKILSIDSLVVPVVLEPMSIANPYDKLAADNVSGVIKKELCMEIDSLNETENKINLKDNENKHTTKKEPDYELDVEFEDMCNNDFGNFNTDCKPTTSEINKNNVEKVTDVKISKTRRIAKTSSTEVKVETKRQKNIVHNFAAAGEFKVITKRQKKIVHNFVAAAEVKVITKRQKKNIEDTVVPAKGKRRKKELKWKRTAEDDYMPKVDLEEFKKTCDVDIVILTQEEQVAEIEARRATDEYKKSLYRCEPCGKHFKSEDAYNHHKVKHDQKAGPHECAVCKIRYNWKTKRLRHYDTHRFKFVCRQCGFVSRTRHQAKSHHEWHAGKRYQCQYCGKEYSKQSTYLTHVRLSHKVLNVVCDMCGETFVSESGLRSHKAYVHGAPHQKQSKSMECKTCSVTFISLDALERHKMAAGEHGLMSACAQCGDSFHSEATLREHMGEHHPSCEQCNSTFLNTESYNVHIKRKHLGKGDGWNDRRREANRRARALGVAPPYPPLSSKPNKNTSKVCCEHCGNMFQNATLLSYHLRKHRGEKLPHACALCPKSFHIKQLLERHMSVHTGEKPFKCEQCAVGFTSKGNLQRHVRTAHLKIHPRIPCPICERVFTTNSCVRVHINTVHHGQPGPKRDRRKRKNDKMPEPPSTISSLTQ